MPLTFDRGRRLRSRAEFVAVQDRGVRVPFRYFTLLGLPNGRGVTRLGIVASRRFGGAVVRNRAKRRLREVFRQHIAHEARGRAGLDLVVIARRELVDASFPSLQQEFLRAIDRLRAVKTR